MVNSRYRGFALPSVMIASVVMLMVMVTALSAVATTRVALDEQYYNQLAREAAESGLTVAKRCFVDENTTWSAPLRPGGGCGGTASQESGANSYVVSSDLIRSTFEVALSDGTRDSATLRSTGTVELLRKSTGTAWATYAQSMSQLQQTTEVPGVTWRQVVSGPRHTCALASDNKAYCWGSGEDGRLGNGSTADQLMPVAVSRGAMPANATIIRMAAHDRHTCAIASNNKAYCWGYAGNGRLGNGQASGTYSTPVAVSLGARVIPEVTEIAAGQDYTCAIGSNSRLYCWGKNSDYGQTGDGSTTDNLTPVAVARGDMPADQSARNLSASSWHACAVGSDNRAYCWGRGQHGQRGDGTTVSVRRTPALVSQGDMPAGGAVRSISAGINQTCAIATADNNAYCWGLGRYGRLAQGDETDRSVPTRIQNGDIPSTASINSIATGGGHTCAAASDGRAYCWGHGLEGRLGNGEDDNDRHLPTLVKQGAMQSDTVVQEITTMSGSHVCAITSDDRAYCWGNGGHGRLGTGSEAHRSTPAAVNYVPFNGQRPLLNDQVAAGESHSCGLGSDGKAYCWGRNSHGQLGNGNTEDSSTPVAVSRGEMPSYTKIRKVVVGALHTCAVASDGKAYCWGDGTSGRLGRNNSISSSVPVAVSRGSVPTGLSILDITAGAAHNCVIASNHLPYCWGQNDSLQIGNGTANRLVPITVLRGARPLNSSVLQIKAGQSHTCALVSDYNVYCWGSREHGQLGNGVTSTTPVQSPARVTFSGNIWQVEAGRFHNCIIDSLTQGYCWGLNADGQVGDGTTVTPKTTPTAVANGSMPSTTGIVSMGFSGSHYNSCFIARNHKAYCWGANSNAQLGRGSTTVSRTPYPVSRGQMPASTTTVLQVSMGQAHACAVAEDGQTYCWGDSEYGRLGDGAAIRRLTPWRVLPLEDFPPVAPDRSLVF